ncbi:MAG TPA: glycosyltransferase family 39 protein [Vicinamibacterales bacterium]|nr:glycosyltransferase family 39 protein [Vicinamibacterales bacterium]
MPPGPLGARLETRPVSWGEPVAPVDEGPRSRRDLRLNAAAFGLLLALTLVLQLSVGTYGTERGHFSDEAGHFMNGLLIRDYLTEGLGENPIEFAQEYYLNYPKIAPGMWPPLYHGVLGLVLLPGWAPETAALLLIALASAWTGWRLFRILSYMTSRRLAFALAALFLCAPVIVNISSAVMLDIVVAAFALEATYWLALYVSSGNWRHAALYGLFAAGGCLTKGNGLAILLLPALVALFAKRLDLFRRPGFYLAAAIVLVVAAPLCVMSAYFDATIGDFRMTTWADVVARASFYSRYLSVQLGLPFLAIAGLGLIVGIASPRVNGRPGAALAPSLAALVVAAALFHLLNPHTVYTGRYMTLAVAPLFGLLPSGFGTLLGAIRSARWRNAGRVALVGGLIWNAFLVAPVLAIRRPLGFRDAVTFLEAKTGLAGHRFLVVSDENGEGAFVAEIAQHHPAPAATVLRASKIMASDGWSGEHFTLRYDSAAALMKELEDLHVEYLAVDESLAVGDHPLWGPTRALLETQTDRFEQTHVAQGTRRVVLYRLKYQSPGPPASPKMTISSPLGGWKR